MTPGISGVLLNFNKMFLLPVPGKCLLPLPTKDEEREDPWLLDLRTHDPKSRRNTSREARPGCRLLGFSERFGWVFGYHGDKHGF